MYYESFNYSYGDFPAMSVNCHIAVSTIFFPLIILVIIRLMEQIEKV